MHTRGRFDKMAASMRVLAGGLVQRINLNLLSPASSSCLKRCLNQKNIRKAIAPAWGTSAQTSTPRGVASAPLSTLQRGHHKHDELSTLCSRLAGLSLQAPVQAPGHILRRSFSCLVCSSIPNQTVVSSQVLAHQPHRTVIRYSKVKGRKKTVHAVIDRFYRLDCGLWVRTQSGRKKKLWKKSPSRRYRLKQHIFCNKTQSKMLDNMVSRYWKQRRYYLDDPFEKYHDRHFDVIPPGWNRSGHRD